MNTPAEGADLSVMREMYGPGGRLHDPVVHWLIEEVERLRGVIQEAHADLLEGAEDGDFSDAPITLREALDTFSPHRGCVLCKGKGSPCDCACHTVPVLTAESGQVVSDPGGEIGRKIIDIWNRP